VPVVYPDEFGTIVQATDLMTTARAATERLGITLPGDALARLGALDKVALLGAIKARRDLIGFLDERSYDDGDGSRAAWQVLWDGMRQWDNRSWDWEQIAAGTALVSVCCPVVEEREAMVLARGSTGH
jgi:hypothetical protein